MNFLKEVIQIYIERKDWFLELIAAHIGLSLVAILCAGVIGLLLGIWISEHEKAAGRYWQLQMCFIPFRPSHFWEC